MKNFIGNTATNKTQDLQYEAHTEVAPTRIGDFYRMRLDQALFARFKVSQSTDLKARDMLREHVWKLERDASNLAHCLAKFGDLELKGLDTQALVAEIKSATCMGTNPWARGLALIEKAVQETDPPVSSSINSCQ